MMSKKFKVVLTKQAYKDFQKLDPSLKKSIIQSLQSLTKEQKPQQFKPLRGKNIAQFRIRVGDYRILYDIYESDEVVLILRIGYRKDIYR